MTESIEPISLQAQIVWGDVEQLPVMAASHFLVQASIADVPNVRDLVLTVGYMVPPVILGTPEQQREAAGRTSQVTVRPIARFSIPRGKAADLARILRGMLDAIEAGGSQS